MLMTPARLQRRANKICKLNWRNKKQPAAVAPRKGNCATGCHFRPYSFASSPFDDFADMKNITRKTVCQGCPPLPMAGHLPPVATTPPKAMQAHENNLPIAKKRHVSMLFCAKQAQCGEGRPPAQIRHSGIPTTPRCRALAPLVPRPFLPCTPTLFAICGYRLRPRPRSCINSGLISVNAAFMQLGTL